jgi:type II secretory ATPase GspE/PulE/Tfp pilus assembly ATPase PilB-like protein
MPSTLRERIGEISPSAALGLQRVLDQTHGLVLVSSPTGCGKSTMARALMDARRDRVEPFFHDTVRSADEARRLVDAAAAGLALGVVSASSAIGAILRLEDMCESGEGEMSRLLTEREISSVAVRAIPRLCFTCRTIETRDVGASIRAGDEVVPLASVFYRRGPGCSQCNGGVNGRALVVEVVCREPGPASHSVWSSGPLWRDGLRRAIAGAVSIDAVEDFCGDHLR